MRDRERERMSEREILRDRISEREDVLSGRDREHV